MKFDLNNKGFQIGLVVIGGIFIGLLAYVELSKKNKIETPHAYNPQKQESQIDLLKKRVRKKPKREVTNYSVDNLIAQQVNKDPFARDTVKEVVVIEKESAPQQKTVVQSSTPKPKVVYIERKAPTPQHQPKQRRRRRAGFSSNNTLSGSSQTAETVKTASGTNIEAVIHQDVKVQAGANILLRTTKAGKIGDSSIPANTFITGVVSIGSNRINIYIRGIQLKHRFLSKRLQAYDVDGYPGLRLSKDLNYELKNDGANAAIDEISKQARIPYLGTLTKSIAKKKVNTPSIPIRKGHRIIIKDYSGK